MAPKLELAVHNTDKDVALHELYKLYIRKTWAAKRLTYEDWLESQRNDKS